jgi:gliding motility-associated-like protein
MNSLKLILLSLFLFCLMVSATGQDVTQPLSPQLDYVTVDPYTGYATIRWLPSLSGDVGSYIVYTYSNGIADAVDTIRSPYITEYTHTLSAARYMSITYVVAAMDSSLNISPLSNPLSTIYLEVKNDSCKQRIELRWTPYFNQAHPADLYELWLSAGGAPAVLHETVVMTDTSYLFDDYLPATRYCFYITASGNAGGLSSSNMQCVTSGSETAPSWIRTDAITVEGGALLVTGSYDQATDMLGYVTERYKPESQGWTITGTAAGLNGIVTITVTAGDTNSINLYRISALNNCGREVASSPPARNIVLTSSTTNTLIDLTWNNPLPAGDAVYSVWRDIGQGWEEVALLLSDTLWSEDYSLFASAVSSASVAYYVTAADSEAPASVPLFRSNITLIGATENIFMPNAFTPDDDGVNDIFLPVITFTPSKYEFRVYNRTGVLLFHTSSHGTGWDGRHNDKPMPSGVYLWSLKLTTPSGHSEQRTGTVTILP